MTRTIDSEDALCEAIQALEAQQEAGVKRMKSQIDNLYESIQPVNLIKSTVQEISASKELKQKFIAIAVGLAVGHLSRFIYQTASKSPLKSLIGPALQLVITNFISGKPETVQKIGAQAVKVVQAVVSEASQN